MNEINAIQKRHNAKRTYLPGNEWAEEAHRDRATLLTKVNALQAQIDMLMLEWCPEEMTEEQMDNWAKYQVPVDEATEAAIEAALEQGDAK